MNSSNKHGNYRRPEITRNNDLLAQDQRKILEYQRKQLENLEQRNRSELFGLINSKIYSNLQENADFCFDMCTKGVKATLNTLKGLSTPLSNTNKHLEMATDFGCLDKCMLKKGESFKMLLFYFFEKMKIQEETKDDYEVLYDVPDKFKKDLF